MKIKSIKLKDFKRFTDLSIERLPETAKLVVMIGPNGCGKSSVFDALNAYAYKLGMMADDVEYSEKYHQDMNYYTKSNEPKYSPSYYKSLQQTQEQREISYEWDIANSYSPDRTWHDVTVEFDKDIGFPGSYIFDKSIRVRTAYRNSSVLPYTINRIDLTKERRRGSLIENDEVFASNYWKLTFQWLERSSEIGENQQNLVDLENEVFGELRAALGGLFNDPPLVLKNLGNPLDGDFFQFDKGTSERFSFQNLASGEKAALDLLLDVIVTKAEYDETIICIDEPEAHIHTKLQGQLLEELYNLIPDTSQLWIATHSIGMVRKAQDLWQADPDSVVFLDFGKDEFGKDHDFDGQVTIKPVEPNPNFWASTYDVALGDLAELVVTGRTVFCEGEEFDAECYGNIFKDTYPEVCFVSLGARSNVEKSVKAANLAIEKIVKSAKVIGIVDRDKATCGEIKRNAEKGIRTLSRTTIESYLLDDEVLTKLCEDHGESDKVNNLLTAKQDALQKNKLKSSDNLKPIVQQVHGAAQKTLKSANLGNTRESFMMDVLAPLIQPGMKVYEELHEDIFGE